MTESSEPRFVEVYRARSSAQAHLIKNALQEAGVPAIVENDLLQGVLGDVPLGWATAPRVLVEESQAALSRSIVERLGTSSIPEDVPEPEDGGADEAMRCLACGEVIPEDEDRCPACGWSYQEEGDES
jgi:hypothetical protein